MIPTVLIAVVIGFLILKFIFKPIFKILGLVMLVAVAWWFIKGGF